MKFYSQDGQDRLIAELFKYKRQGTFLEIGAFDGTTFSNTLFLEKELQWTGICIEPNPKIFSILKANRKCICINCCVANFEGKHRFLAVSGAASMLSGILEFFDDKHIDRINRIIEEKGGDKKTCDIPVIPLRRILEENEVAIIDYCSIDVEGGEFEVLKSIDFSKTKVRVLTVENNNETKDVFNYLKPLGYKLLTKVGADEVYELHSKRYSVMIKYRVAKIKHSLSKVKRKFFS